MFQGQQSQFQKYRICPYIEVIMGLGKKYVNDVNALLMKKRSSSDSILSLNFPETRLRRFSEKINWALRTVHKNLQGNGKDVKFFHIVLSLQEYFDMNWVVENILDEENRILIKSEMLVEYNIKSPTIKTTMVDEVDDSDDVDDELPEDPYNLPVVEDIDG